MRERLEPATADSAVFDYDTAFSRNIGWISEWEQQALRGKTVAIAGMGGVGGAHALTLARLGIGGFHVADLDRFDVVNLNRQAGAFVSTMQRDKTDVMATMIRDINPELRLQTFADGIDDNNIDAFLEGVDLFVDGFDFFVLAIRRKVFKRCAELGIPAITAAPIGLGTSYIVFMPGGMSFEQYFRFEGLSEERQYVNFAVGLTPKGFHRAYMVDPSRIDLAGKRGPSNVAAIQLCSGVVAAEAVKILLGRGKVHAAPAYHQFDAYRGTWHRGYLRAGNNGPLQSLKRQIGYKAFAGLSQKARPKEEPATGPDIERILDLARWAPSGDNAQPWRFEIVDDDRLIVHLTPKRDIYDYNDGQPSRLAAGMLLETMRIAASHFGRLLEWKYLGQQEGNHRIAVALPQHERVREDPLLPYLAVRSVDRRGYRTRSLEPADKSQLEDVLAPSLRIVWHEQAGQRLRQARLNALSSDVRLRSPVTYTVHREVIHWNESFSRRGIPVDAIGIDAMTKRLMRWVMGAWERQQFFNRFLQGTLMPRIQLDLLPGLRSAAHFAIERVQPAGSEDETVTLLKDGMLIQRFWLTATCLGLAVQPTLSPLIFAHYGRSGGSALGDAVAEKGARKLAQEMQKEGNNSAGDMIFRGRIGRPNGKPVASRSIRLRVADLLYRPDRPKAAT